jgi:hypothetical protein
MKLKHQPATSAPPNIGSVDSRCLQSIASRIDDPVTAMIVLNLFVKEERLKERFPGIYMMACETHVRHLQACEKVQASKNATQQKGALLAQCSLLLLRITVGICFAMTKLCLGLKVSPRRHRVSGAWSR